jgi:hypothetical protein
LKIIGKNIENKNTFQEKAAFPRAPFKKTVFGFLDLEKSGDEQSASASQMVPHCSY